MTKGINYGLIVAFVGIIGSALAIGLAGNTMLNLNELETQVEANKANAISALTRPDSEFDDTDILQALANIELEQIDQRNEYTREIVQTRKLLQDAQIGTGDSQLDKLDEQSGTGTSPKLTIHLDSSEFIRGEIIWVSGTSDPKVNVEATVTDPKLSKRSPNGQSDQRGEWKIAIITKFDSPLGTYTVYVRSQGELSQTLSFVLIQ